MATSLSISIPQLGEKQTFEEYEPLFTAAVSTYLVTEEGRAAIIKTLPAYIARREAQRAIAIEAAKKGTLEEAFKLLKESLDPPVNVYEKTRKYYDMHWTAGQYVDDYFVRMWREAKRAKHTTRQACTNMISQLPDKVAVSMKA